MVMIVYGGVVQAKESTEKSPEDPEVRRAYRMGTSLAEGDILSTKIDINRFGHHVLLKAFIDEDSMELACMLCTPSEVLSKARELGVLFAAKRVGKAPASLTVFGMGEADMVVVDGLPMVPGKKDHPIEPGEHHIVLVQDGRIKKTSSLIAPEQKLEIDARMVEVPSQQRTYTRLKVLLGGRGLTAAAIGGVLLWLDGNCSTDDCKYLHDTAPAGWTLVSVGVAAEIGLLLWLFLPRANTESAMEAEK